MIIVIRRRILATGAQLPNDRGLGSVRLSESQIGARRHARSQPKPSTMSPPSAALARRSSLQTAPRALRIVRRSPRAKEDQSDGPAAADIRLPPDRHLSNCQLSTISYSPASRRSLPRLLTFCRTEVSAAASCRASASPRRNSCSAPFFGTKVTTRTPDSRRKRTQPRSP